MSRYTEIHNGTCSNEFEIQDEDGYYKWKESLTEEDCGEILLHENKDKDKSPLIVHVGIRWDKEPLYELDTNINHFNPDDDGVLTFWSGLSLFTKEPIILLLTDEEWPSYTKVFSDTPGEDAESGMWRLWAHHGKVIIQTLEFKIVKTERFTAKDLIDEEVLSALKDKKKSYCDKCKKELNLAKFNFENRGYYEELKNKGYKKLCESCYKELKEPLTKIRQLENEIKAKQATINVLKEK